MALTPTTVFPNPTQAFSAIPAPGGYTQSGHAQSPTSKTWYNGRGAPLQVSDVLDVMPYVSAVNTVAPAIAYLTANALVPLITATTNGSSVQTITSRTAILLDCPRNVSITVSTGTAVTWTVKGLDIYRNPMTENIATTVTGGVQTIYGKKAFWCVFSVTGSAVLAGGVTVSVGCGGSFGFRYAVPTWGYITQMNIGEGGFANEGQTAIIANGTQTTTINDISIISSTIPSVTLLGSGGGNTTTGVQATVTTGTITLTSTNATGVATNVTAAQSYFVTWHNQLFFALKVADTTSPATATTGDVRGTFQLDQTTAWDHTQQISVHSYVRGANCALNAALVASGQPQLGDADLIGVTQFS